jgi:hypothetical protein
MTTVSLWICLCTSDVTVGLHAAPASHPAKIKSRQTRILKLVELKHKLYKVCPANPSRLPPYVTGHLVSYTSLYLLERVALSDTGPPACQQPLLTS